MGYTALYRKFRPITFSEMVGQTHITQTLRNQIVANRVGHAYLFNGSRGTGKTSAAKILARAINCINPKDGEPCNECEICKGALNGSLTDILEMDAASNNSVEDIRNIREEVNFLPTKAKYRVYIIDEVHMLSSGAFNALLKTLEEPPEHVKFILATTEPQKLPTTILSRCQRFDFKRISNEHIIERLKIVCNESKIEITESALNVIANLSEGAMRDALSILERCVQDGTNKINEDKIKDLVGIPKITIVHGIIDAISEYDIDKALENIQSVISEGKDLDNFIWEIIKYSKDILIYKISGKVDLYSDEEKKLIKIVSEKIDKERLVNLIFNFSQLENDMKWSNQKSIMFQAGIIKLCSKEMQEEENIKKRIDKIENYLKLGNNTSIKKNERSKSEDKRNENINISSNNSRNIQSLNVNQKDGEKKKAITKSTENKYSSNLKESWPKILNDIKQSGKIVLYSNLINTNAQELNDMTVGISFPKGISSFGRAVIEKQENIREISKLVSIACGKEMQIKFISNSDSNSVSNKNPVDEFKQFAENANLQVDISD